MKKHLTVLVRGLGQLDRETCILAGCCPGIDKGLEEKN
jgi:hypothetical protein